MNRILTVIGARPQFIKASVVSMAIAECPELEEIVVHTGQHFDENMSGIFFDQLGLSRPRHQLNISGGSHGGMTGRMLIEVERILLEEKPDRVLVYGDTNSTLAGALAAAKLNIPIAHVEAGLRSFNMRMPEEINRILTDQLSDILFCPTDAAMENLRQEGFANKKSEILKVGDVMQDSAVFFAGRTSQRAVAGVEGENFILATLHRAENTDDPVRLAAIVAALNKLHATLAQVVLPLHPRTREALKNAGLTLDVTLIDPVGYLEMIVLLQRSALVLTDSGGVQKEAFFFGKPCVTLREQTEWVELIDIGANTLVGADVEAILAAARANLGRKVVDEQALYGGGQAAKRIARHLAK
ncbi:UDP-N-acetylglucosamine 2-epimerase (non-hydrolyzing) [Variovorax sp. ZS18.2.2]|uniref:non-hydrolyzing UDP-N-acetylglucosamine 2-epimerase n=1 Tax=Variovorax sp. ZS18.2.2 TaxID=2971255 RepID=UPI0021516C0C|nr:UDP-N-acetylglucosamine 2-epimerase (non-hydrolyzing) [Variovorax sp. ZS18.2.2]MCR6477496.1 UDP-N-acetylglucosamine 2-epimerase (non-hydrolyzing) [Variovorax sp. ZS18.2.2]